MSPGRPATAGPTVVGRDRPDRDAHGRAASGEHQLRWAEGRLIAMDHPDVDRERALVALGGAGVPCLDLLDAWNAHTDDLDLLVLASRGPSDRLPDPQPSEGVRYSGSYTGKSGSPPLRRASARTWSCVTAAAGRCTGRSNSGLDEFRHRRGAQRGSVGQPARRTHRPAGRDRDRHLDRTHRRPTTIGWPTPEPSCRPLFTDECWRRCEAWRAGRARWTWSWSGLACRVRSLPRMAGSAASCRSAG